MRVCGPLRRGKADAGRPAAQPPPQPFAGALCRLKVREQAAHGAAALKGSTASDCRPMTCRRSEHGAQAYTHASARRKALERARAPKSNPITDAPAIAEQPDRGLDREFGHAPATPRTPLRVGSGTGEKAKRLSFSRIQRFGKGKWCQGRHRIRCLRRCFYCYKKIFFRRIPRKNTPTFSRLDANGLGHQRTFCLFDRTPDTQRHPFLSARILLDRAELRAPMISPRREKVRAWALCRSWLTAIFGDRIPPPRLCSGKASQQSVERSFMCRFASVAPGKHTQAIRVASIPADLTFILNFAFAAIGGPRQVKTALAPAFRPPPPAIRGDRIPPVL